MGRNEILFGAKSIGKMYLQSQIDLLQRDSETGFSARGNNAKPMFIYCEITRS